MREIKFRAWDGKRWHFWGLNVSETGAYFTSPPHNNLKHCQFTGLKDKNGKEIYEGDILNSNRNDCPVSVVIWIAEIFSYKSVYLSEYKKYIKDSGNWIAISNNLYAMSLGWIEGQEFEVIGNIYENPELLRG